MLKTQNTVYKTVMRGGIIFAVLFLVAISCQRKNLEPVNSKQQELIAKLQN
jgi:hypothetical protein